MKISASPSRKRPPSNRGAPAAFPKRACPGGGRGGGSGHRCDPAPTRRGAAGDAARGRRLRTAARKAPQHRGSPGARRPLRPSRPAPRRARARVGAPRGPLVSARPRQRERLAAVGPGGGRCVMADASFCPNKKNTKTHNKKKKKNTPSPQYSLDRFPANHCFGDAAVTQSPSAPGDQQGEGGGRRGRASPLRSPSLWESLLPPRL
ncbi:uncharacterized protein LOC107311769 [Coturnix japonica]|uniref:uncharacterized protein LOC107311769 n=1 Tax=Coturnix japonica TaxID=93934 RepID=UPI000776FC11|nr:uncharacterized protein LOC107311769 [Coturnix japonica]